LTLQRAGSSELVSLRGQFVVRFLKIVTGQQISKDPFALAIERNLLRTKNQTLL